MIHLVARIQFDESGKRVEALWHWDYPLGFAAATLSAISQIQSYFKGKQVEILGIVLNTRESLTAMVIEPGVTLVSVGGEADNG